MYNFFENYNKAVSQYNNSREVSRPRVDEGSRYDRYDFDRHNEDIKRYNDNKEVRFYPVTD